MSTRIAAWKERAMASTATMPARREVLLMLAAARLHHYRQYMASGHCQDLVAVLFTLNGLSALHRANT